MKQEEINQLVREKEGMLYNYNCSHHIWLWSIATDKVLVEKEQQLTGQKEGELQFCQQYIQL